ncbi:MAG: hypothetical protein WAT39_13405 [Planctomycetota bacterium]
MRTSESVAVTLLLAFAVPGQDGPAAPGTGGRCLSAAIGVSRHDDAVTGIGPGYTLRTTTDSVTYLPMLGSAAPRSLPLTLRFLDARRGDTPVATTPAQRETGERHIAFDRGSVHERYELRADGVEQTFVFARQPMGTGDLVVRLAVSCPVAGVDRSDGGIQFLENGGGVTYGALTGVDANGTHCAGAVRLVDDHLELTLPARFVDGAAYPLTFDPLLGTASLLAVGNDDGDPDIHDSSVRTFVTWRRTAAFGESQLLGMLYLTTPTTPPFVIDDTPGANVAGARIGLAGTSNSFVVAWQRAFGPLAVTPALLAVRVNPAASPGNPPTFSNIVTLASTAGQLAVGDSASGSGLLPVAWVEPAGAVRVETVSTQFAGLSIAGGPPPLATATAAGARVALSRSGGTVTNERHFVVWSGDAVDPLNLRGAVLGASTTLLAGPVALTLGASPKSRPAVDGTTTNLLISWNTDTEVVVQRFTANTAGTTLGPVGSQTILSSGLPGTRRNGDLVRTDSGRFLAAWMTQTSAVDTNVAAQALTETAAPFGLAMDLGGPPRAGSYTRRGAPRLVNDGIGTFTNDVVHAVFEEGQAVVPFDRDIVVQDLEAFGPGGAVVSLAPGCGFGGTAGVNGPCAVGNASFAFTVTGCDPTAPLVLLSLAAPVTPLPCGPCTLLPPTVLETFVVLGGAAQRPLPIPADNSLVGAQIGAQWLPVFGLPGPCSTFPFLSASNLIQATIGF